MNMDKAKIMCKVHITPMLVIVGSTKLEVVDEYIYQEHIDRRGKCNVDREVNRRMQLSWVAFGKLRYIFSKKKEELEKEIVQPVRVASDDLWI